MRYAIINKTTNKVINVIDYDVAPVGSPPGFDANHIAVSNDSVSPNWTWDGVSLSPPTPVPTILPVTDPIDTWDLISFRIGFNHENRIRVLEGKPSITPAQFKAALRALP